MNQRQKLYEKALLFKNGQKTKNMLLLSPLGEDHHLVHKGVTDLYQDKAQLIAFSFYDKNAHFMVCKRHTAGNTQTILTLIE